MTRSFETSIIDYVYSSRVVTPDFTFAREAATRAVLSSTSGREGVLDRRMTIPSIL